MHRERQQVSPSVSLIGIHGVHGGYSSPPNANATLHRPYIGLSPPAVWEGIAAGSAPCRSKASSAYGSPLKSRQVGNLSGLSSTLHSCSGLAAKSTLVWAPGAGFWINLRCLQGREDPACRLLPSASRRSWQRFRWTRPRTAQLARKETTYMNGCPPSWGLRVRSSAVMNQECCYLSQLHASAATDVAHILLAISACITSQCRMTAIPSRK